jgi:hypothetical protein
VSNGDAFASSGEICLADPAPAMCMEPSDGFLCSLPATTPAEAADFLEAVGSGAPLGSGVRMYRLGVSMPVIREAYAREIHALVKTVERMQREGQSTSTIARHAVVQRRLIANRMRSRSGVGTRLLFEVRDWAEYGPGGRSLRNVEARYVRRGYSGAGLHQQMIRGATHPNTGISNTAIRGARYLRHGGRVILVISLPVTAYVLLTTPPDQLPRVLSREAGGFLGGAAGSGLGVGACLVFGIATGGWGLLACGIVGGVAGGALGTLGGERAYAAARPGVETQVLRTGILDAGQLVGEPTPQMCVAPYAR